MARGPAAWLRNPLVRRALSVSTVQTSAAALTTTAGAWLPLSLAWDARTARGRRDLPSARCLAFLTAWSSLESIGAATATALWATGRADDVDAHYALQSWWADRLVDALRVTANLRIEVNGLDQLAPGPVVMCSRHTSIADTLLPVWLLTRAGMRARYVLKDDLAIDPCLDIVGNRLPNHFVNREAADSAADIVALEALSAGMGPRDAAVIYPEGVVVTEARRIRALDAVTRRDAMRGDRVRSLRRLAPVRPAGTLALLRANPAADLVTVMHTGFEPLAEVAQAPRVLPLREPVRIAMRRVERATIPLHDDATFTEWFDDVWARCDRDLARGIIDLTTRAAAR